MGLGNMIENAVKKYLPDVEAKLLKLNEDAIKANRLSMDKALVDMDAKFDECIRLEVEKQLKERGF